MSYVQDEFQAFIEDPAAGCELKPALTTNYSKAATAITYLCPDIRDGRGEGLEIVRSRLLVFLFQKELEQVAYQTAQQGG